MFRQVMIVLLTVVVLGAVAEAGFQIGMRYVDGRPFDPDTDVLDINESLYLSVYTDEPEHGHLNQYAWALVCDKSLANIMGGEAGPDAPWGVTFYGPASQLWDIPGSVPEDEDGRYGAIEGVQDIDPGLYLDKFLYTPISAGDVLVRFLRLDTSGGEIVRVPDSIVIHQVPEPVTIALLGLGAFFTLRRK